MDRQIAVSRYFMLFIPWILSLLFADYPVAAYLLSWLGSFFIFYVSLSGRVKPLQADLPFSEQLMRPVILIQLLFAGYMCCTSIFYFLDVLGYADSNFADPHYLIDKKKLALTAQCQRYYCLAHAAFVCGLLFSMPIKIQPVYQYNVEKLHRLLLYLTCTTFGISHLLGFVNGLNQFSHQLNMLSFIAGTMALSHALFERKTNSILLCLLMYTFNFYQALTSGFKEPIIISILVLAIFMYPKYRKTVVLTFLPLLLSLFMFLPTYNRIFREHAWSEDLSASTAGALALEAVFHTNLSDDNWSFFTQRLSEVNMFNSYLQSTPDHTGYYGFDLVQQTLISIVPRILWSAKPNTEQLVMQRVYKAGVVQPGSSVSAKPAFIVDAYLSGGVTGIFICLFGFGVSCQRIANKAESLFGGYKLGIAVIFTGLFQVLWRGQCFEFLLNAVCWSYISMYLIFLTLRITHILNPS